MPGVGMCKVHIVKAGALPSLVKLTAMGRERLDVSRYCGMTLSNLACHRQNRVPVVQAAGLKPLCHMALDGERLEMQRAAGLALYNLSCSAANQVHETYLCDSDGLVEDLDLRVYTSSPYREHMCDRTFLTLQAPICALCLSPMMTYFDACIFTQIS